MHLWVQRVVQLKRPEDEVEDILFMEITKLPMNEMYSELVV